MRDWEGNPVPEVEDPETEIFVWEIEPHIDNSYTSAYIRGWQEMLDFVKELAESECEFRTEEELQWDGVDIKIRLRKIAKSDYDEMCRDA